MRFINVKQVNKKLILGILWILILIVMFCGLFYLMSLPNYSVYNEVEVDRLNTCFGKVSEYQIIKVPDWAELAPANVSVEQLRYYPCLLQDEEDRNRKTRTYEGKYIKVFTGYMLYTFDSRKTTEKYFSKLTDEEKKRFRLLGNSILYIGDNEKLEKIVKEVEILLEKEK
jgi:hypothetical protein